MDAESKQTLTDAGAVIAAAADIVNGEITSAVSTSGERLAVIPIDAFNRLRDAVRVLRGDPA